jgi:Tat protein translocase TatB subunit
MNSIFGIGVLEFIFILIFALIFLGPERLPKVTRDVLHFIRRLQKLSGDLTRQVNEEIGDLRELDPSFHLKELMGEEEEEEGKSIGRKDSQDASASEKQTSAPSQPGQAADAESASSEQETIAPAAASSTTQPVLSDLNASASSNGRQQSGEDTEANPKSTGTAIPSAPRASSSKASTRSPAVGAAAQGTSSGQKRGVKTLSELRKQQRTKRQSASSGSDSSYLEERNKRAQRRADDRRDAVAAQKNVQEEASEPEDAAPDPVDAEVSNESTVLAELGGNFEGSREGVSDTDVLAEEGDVDSGEGAVAAVAEDADGEGSEETKL